MDHQQNKRPIKRSKKDRTASKRRERPGKKEKEGEKDILCIHLQSIEASLSKHWNPRKAMSIMNSFANDIFERIASEASRLSTHNVRSKISSRDL